MPKKLKGIHCEISRPEPSTPSASQSLSWEERENDKERRIEDGKENYAERKETVAYCAKGP